MTATAGDVDLRLQEKLQTLIMVAQDATQLVEHLARLTSLSLSISARNRAWPGLPCSAPGRAMRADWTMNERLRSPSCGQRAAPAPGAAGG